MRKLMNFGALVCLFVGCAGGLALVDCGGGGGPTTTQEGADGSSATSDAGDGATPGSDASPEATSPETSTSEASATDSSTTDAADGSVAEADAGVEASSSTESDASDAAPSDSQAAPETGTVGGGADGAVDAGGSTESGTTVPDGEAETEDAGAEAAAEDGSAFDATVGVGGQSDAGDGSSTFDGGVSAVIGAGGGVVGSATFGMWITIPAGALSQNTTITVTEVASTIAGNVTPVYDIEPTGTQFASAVTVTFVYTTGDLDGSTLDQVAVSTNVGNYWQPVGQHIVDTSTNTISGTTNHLSLYTTALVSTCPTPTTSSSGMYTFYSYVLQQGTIDSNSNDNVYGEIILYGLSCAGNAPLCGADTIAGTPVEYGIAGIVIGSPGGPQGSGQGAFAFTGGDIFSTWQENTWTAAALSDVFLELTLGDGPDSSYIQIFSDSLAWYAGGAQVYEYPATWVFNETWTSTWSGGPMNPPSNPPIGYASTGFADPAVGSGGASSTSVCCEDQSTTTYCNDSCVDLQIDSNNCGDCGEACSPSVPCVAGSCGCQGADIACNGACVDSRTDNSNCGECGAVCSVVGGTCSNYHCGTCTASVMNLVITPPASPIVPLGSTAQLTATATVNGTGGTDVTALVTWSSANASGLAGAPSIVGLTNPGAFQSAAPGSISGSSPGIATISASLCGTTTASSVTMYVPCSLATSGLALAGVSDMYGQCLGSNICCADYDTPTSTYTVGCAASCGSGASQVCTEATTTSCPSNASNCILAESNCNCSLRYVAAPNPTGLVVCDSD